MNAHVLQQLGKRSLALTTTLASPSFTATQASPVWLQLPPDTAAGWRGSRACASVLARLVVILHHHLLEVGTGAKNAGAGGCKMPSTLWSQPM